MKEKAIELKELYKRNAEVTLPLINFKKYVEMLIEDYGEDAIFSCTSTSEDGAIFLITKLDN